MLSPVRHTAAGQEWLESLGWEPHPMRSSFDLITLAGGDDW